MRPVPCEIRLIAFTTNEDGTRSVYDIVETSFHYASSFARRFIRDPEVSSFVACPPNKAWTRATFDGPEWKKAAS